MGSHVTSVSAPCCSCNDEPLHTGRGGAGGSPTRGLSCDSSAAAPSPGARSGSYSQRDCGLPPRPCPWENRQSCLNDSCNSARLSCDRSMASNHRLLLASSNGDLTGIHEALASGADIETKSRLPSLRCGSLGGGGADKERERIDFEEVLVLGDHGTFQSKGEIVALGPPVSPSGHTPLMRAAKGGHAKAVSMLLERSATPHTQDEDGMTPLHFAAAAGCRASCAALLMAGANRWVLDHLERDPFACLPMHLISSEESAAAWLALLRSTHGTQAMGHAQMGQSPASKTLHYRNGVQLRRQSV